MSFYSDDETYKSWEQSWVLLIEFHQAIKIFMTWDMDLCMIIFKAGLRRREEWVTSWNGFLFGILTESIKVLTLMHKDGQSSIRRAPKAIKLVRKNFVNTLTGNSKFFAKYPLNILQKNSIHQLPFWKWAFSWSDYDNVIRTSLSIHGPCIALKREFCHRWQSKISHHPLDYY